MGAPMYRAVHNEQTDSYRVEKRGLLGWDFVDDPRTGDYLQFEKLAQARRWVCEQPPRDANSLRRWKVVSECNA